MVVCIYCKERLTHGVYRLPQLFRIALITQYGVQFVPKVLNGDYLWILDNWLGGSLSTEWVLRDEWCDSLSLNLWNGESYLNFTYRGRALGRVCRWWGHACRCRPLFLETSPFFGLSGAQQTCLFQFESLCMGSSLADCCRLSLGTVASSVEGARHHGQGAIRWSHET